MKRIATLGLSILFILATVAVSASSNVVKAQNAGLISSILNSMERNRQNLKSLRASISMEKFNAQIGSRDINKGSVIYLPASGRTANVRVDWISPRVETLSVVGGAYTLFRPKLNIAYQGTKPPQGAGGPALSLLSMSGSQARSSYDVSYINEETLWGGISASHLKIVPKGNAGYKHAEIWVDNTGMVVQSKIVENNDDATTIRLTDVQKNSAVSLDQIKVQLPGSVKIVKT
jgi:outer membrane lipoprotein-sorting protein